MQAKFTLSDATTKIALGDLRYRVEIDSDDEIGELAGSFNGMVEGPQKRTGTTITLYLPASTKAAEEPKGAKGEVLSGKGDILVMDDDPTIQALASAMLNKLGYDTAVAGNGDEAIALFRSARESHRPFDAVLMDLTIPGGMGGKEVIKHLISIDRQVKAIVSSGYSSDPVMANYQEYGFSGVAAKPYTIQSLSSAIHTALDRPAS